MTKIKLVATSLSDNKYCRCENCGKTIAEIKEDRLVPSFEECYKSGNVPVPNFGWLCSQNCATEFEKSHDVKFDRTKDGKVDYYWESLGHK